MCACVCIESIGCFFHFCLCHFIIARPFFSGGGEGAGLDSEGMVKLLVIHSFKEILYCFDVH